MRGFALIAGLAAALAALLPAGGAVRAESVLKKLSTMTDSRGFEAVGRIDFGGEAFCTGSLISPDTVLTAAHCLYDSDRRLFPVAKIRFLAGWRDGKAIAVRSVRAAVVHPDYAPGARPMTTTPQDLALLRLDQPVANSLVAPFGIADLPVSGDRVSVVSYAFDRPDSPSLEDNCHVLQRQSGMLVLDCDVDFGSSGSPVLVRRHGVPVICSVISAKAEARGKKVSLGAGLGPQVALLRRLLDAEALRAPGAAPQVRRLAVGGARDAGGAKFVRP